MRRGGDQRLADHLAAEDALPADLRAAAAEEIVLERLEIEDGEKRSTAVDMGCCGRLVGGRGRRESPAGASGPYASAASSRAAGVQARASQAG